jgi:uncharacterized protein with ATP-grasp and redox domains
MLADNDFKLRVRAAIESLLSEIPDGPIRFLDDEDAPDAVAWSRYIERYTGMDWLQPPWFFVEPYFYRRIMEAIGYFRQVAGKKTDPFIYQKRQGLVAAQRPLRALFAQLQPFQAGNTDKRETLATLLTVNLWGNQVDLSLWPVDADEKPDHTDRGQQKAHTLVDHSQATASYLDNLNQPNGRIDVILDNAGFELVTDLILVAYLLANNLVEQVVLHAKPHPTYVSDAMIKDVFETISKLEKDDHPSVSSFGELLAGLTEDERLKVVDDWFWTSPLEMWHMPQSLKEKLQQASLVVSKGDYNYRRLLGDRHWPFTTDFGDVVSYSPAPLLALRTLKSEVVIGLTPEQIEEVALKDPNWLNNGRWGLIQFWNTNDLA